MISTFVLSGISLVIYLIVIWYEHIWRVVDDDTLAKVMAWLAIWTIALPHMALLSLSSFRGFYLWVRRAAIWMVFLLALSITICALVEGEPHEDFWIREIGVFGILTALGTITVPILMKVAGIEKEASIESTSLDIKITCPRCLLEQVVTSGHSRCSACKLRFEGSIPRLRMPELSGERERPADSPLPPALRLTPGDGNDRSVPRPDLLPYDQGQVGA